MTDKVYVDIHADAAYESPVVHKLLAGSTLEILEESVDFSRVRDAQGREGWIENRDLTRTPPPRIQQAELQRELAGIRAELAKTRAQLRATEEAMAQGTLEEERLAKAQTKLKGQLAGTRAKLAKTNTKLTKAQIELKQARTALTQERAKTAELAEELAQKVAAENQPDPAQMPEPLEAEPPPSQGAPGSGDEPQIAFATKPSARERFFAILRSLDFLWLGVSFAMLVIGFLAGAIWIREKNRRKLGGMHLRI
ncbi:MAG: TIGR04211 family SH3 domain-containing protein [Terriglobia bacterium]